MLQRITNSTTEEPDICFVQTVITDKWYGTRHYIWQERGANDTYEKTILSDIIEGQIENVVRVIRVNPTEGTSRDITYDIADEILTRLVNAPSDGSGIPAHLVEFLESQLGSAVEDAQAELTAPVKSDRQEHSTLNRAQQGV